MILRKHGMPLPSQDELGYQLGLVVPPEKANVFKPVRVGSGPEAGIGTQLYRPEYNFDTVAKKLGWGLRLSYRPPHEFLSANSLRDYLSEVETSDRDVVVCYDFSTLYKTENTSGHVNLFDRVVSDDQVRLIEPAARSGHEDYLWRQADTSTLLTAMVANSELMGGLWDIEIA
jgi:sulfur carrier protein ThiS